MTESSTPIVHTERPPLPSEAGRTPLVHRVLEATGAFSPGEPAGLQEKGTLAPKFRTTMQASRPFGVIDLGSNTARLVIYRSSPVGPPWSVFESKDTPRLAFDLQKDGRLGEIGRSRGVMTLTRFRRLMDVHHVRNYRAVATSAVRDAPNHAAFVSEVQRRSGLRLSVISAADEARYAYLGVASSLPLANDLIMDLGGGSIQLMSVRRGALKESLSLPLGALRLHRRFLEHDPPKRKELEELEEHIERSLKDVPLLEPAEGERTIGVGGTTRAVAHVMQAIRGYPIPRVHGYEMRTRELERLFEIISQSSVAVRKEMPGLSADRADIVVAGLAVVLGVLHRRECEKITVSGTGIREGIAQELLGRSLPASSEDMARGSALATLWAFGLDTDHARRVRELSLELFDLTERNHEHGPEERLALEVAALLHDVGAAVSYPEHAEHGAYLLLSRPLYGLTHRGFLLASLAVGMHEGDDLPPGVLKRYPNVLESGDDEVARRLGSMLAIAESLGDVQPRPRFRRHGDHVSVKLRIGAAPNSRLFFRAARWLRRSLDVEVRARNN